MAKPTQLMPKDLVVGGSYLHTNGIFVRHIDAIEGDTVGYHVRCGLVLVGGGCGLGRGQ